MGDSKTYRTSQLSEILGVTRDALRYYEEKGIVKPKQEEANNYRQYDFYDIYTLMVADFYKKRNLSMKEVKKLQVGSEIDELGTLLEKKAKELEETIRIKTYMLQKIKETKAFCEEVKKNLNQYSIRELPTYEVIGEISDFNAFLEYPAILENMDLLKEDILSKIMRTFTFDENGFLDSKMYIVEKPETKHKEKNRCYLEYSKCIYTIVEDGRYQNGNDDIKYKVFEPTLVWGKEQGLKPKGVAFANTRLITYLDNKERVFLELFIPVEEK
ncbi:MerR family transcriptional regulator [Paenibacillus sp. J2TS4]|uniref:MerR family transcriptional regulator n=1 Tax=Paenibacillus sp. J2TS4 TaxID=2807194 RepID=UPI001B159EC6|nr:MerR family transcriptional regulator [Paenibacillus sp. J2TS4]GIP36482.1 MerR family transcriptional regulator [Paenibacillus sp. J2TS4]